MAIVNGKSGTFNIYTNNSSISGYVKWQETYDNATYITTNQSTITITAYLHRTNIYSGATYITNTTVTRTAFFGSERVTSSDKVSLSIPGSSANGTATTGGGAFTQVYTASKTITHDGSGAKSITIGFAMSNSVSGVAGQSFSVPETYSTITLTTIPRYAVVSHSLKSRTETTISMNWSADNTCDYVWYSTDWGTTWKAVGSVNAKSGSYTISTPSNSTNSLAPYTTYNIVTRCRRKDSQLNSSATKLSVTTYDYPYCSVAPDFVIGNAVKLDFYNPLGRQIGWQMLGADGSLVAGNGTTGTSYSGINGEGSIANLYASIPNSKSGSYTVKVTYGSIVKTKTGGKYSIQGTEYPVINSFGYVDNNTTTVTLTGNNQHIVQNYSSLVAQVGSATPVRSAGGISKYVVECNGKTVESTNAGNLVIGAVNSNRNVDLKLTVTDTRGLSATKTITVTMLAHSNPTATVTLERLNNYEDETYLTVDGSIASVNSKNTMAIKYRYKVSGGSYGSFTNINDRQKYTLSLSKNNSYIFNIVVTDALGSNFSEEFVLNKGVFPLFIDTVKNSVGINCFPKNEFSLEVNELDITTIKEFTKSLKLTANTWTDVGIKYDDLATGTYIMQVILNNNTSAINNQFGERISGILSWYALPTNGTDADVIPVSKAGHSRNGHNIQLRTLRTITANGGVLKLQMTDDVSWNGNGDIVFKFKRLI